MLTNKTGAKAGTEQNHYRTDVGVRGEDIDVRMFRFRMFRFKAVQIQGSVGSGQCRFRMYVGSGVDVGVDVGVGVGVGVAVGTISVRIL